MDASDPNYIIVSSINNRKPQIRERSGKPGWCDRFSVLGKSGYDWIEGESIHWAGSLEFDPFDSKRVFVTSGNGIYIADPEMKRHVWYDEGK